MKVQILQNVQIYRRSGDGDTGCFAVCYMLFISTGIIIVAVCVVDKIQIIGIRRIKRGGNPLFAWVANRDVYKRQPIKNGNNGSSGSGN